MPRLVVQPVRLDDSSAKWALRQLIGTWYDTGLHNAGPTYEVSGNKTGDGFDVRTRRVTGNVIWSDNLIRLERTTNDLSRLVWGRRDANVFEAVGVTTNSVVWKRRHKEFRWRRRYGCRYHERPTTYSHHVRARSICREARHKRYKRSREVVATSPVIDQVSEAEYDERQAFLDRIGKIIGTLPYCKQK